MIYQEDIAFLAHHGVKGQRWGVTRSAKQRARTRKIGDASSDPKTMRATLALRKEMLKDGRLTKEQVRAGNIGFGRNLVLGMLAGGLAGAVLGKGVVKVLGK
jgi:hypothetical protein